MRSIVLVALLALPAAAAPFDGLFKPGTQVLHCAAFGGPRSSLDVTCTIDHVQGNPRTARLTCTGLDLPALEEVAEPFETVILERTDRGVWRAGSGDRIDLAQPPWLPIPPVASHWQQDQEPNHYSGVQHFTFAHGRDWCAAWWPWGYGGAPKGYAVCVTPSGALAGMAGYKSEGVTFSIRCGDAPEPESLLPAHLHP